jgi:DNA-binding response OmpR family regulator
VLVASPHQDLAEHLIADVERSGSVACLARSADGCLRVATAVGPDLVLLDSSLPRRLEGMLRSHPATAAATIVRLRQHRQGDGQDGGMRDAQS